MGDPFTAVFFFFTGAVPVLQNSYSISQYAALWLLWLESGGVVTIVNCQQHSDWAANDSVLTLLPAINSDYTITFQSPSSHSAVYWLME